MLKIKVALLIVCILLVVSCEKATFDTKPLDHISQQTEDIYNKLIVIQQSKDNKENWQKTRNYFQNNISKLLEELDNLPKLEQKPTSDKDITAIEFNKDNLLLRQRKNRLYDILELLNSSVETTDYYYFQEIMEDKSITARIIKLKENNDKTKEETVNSENNALLNSLSSSSELEMQEEKLGLR